MAIEILTWRPCERNTLQGFLDMNLTNVGMEIRGLTLHEKGGKRWIGYPSRSYEENGETKWAAIIRFDDAHHSKFQAACLAALEKYKQEIVGDKK